MKRRKKNRRVEYEKFDDEAYINDMLNEEGQGHRPPQKKKRKKRQGVFLGLMTFILGIVILVFAFLLLFHIQKVEVKGNKYCTQNDIIGWLKEDKYAVNSVYACWRFNQSDKKQLPAVDSSKVTMKNPWTIQITVKEKEIAGYIDYNQKYLYFDKDGTAVLVSSDKLEHAAYLEGMDVDTAKVKLGEVLPVADKDVFQGIVELSQLLVKYELNPDSITSSGSDLNLYFGKVEILLGNKNYEERVAQISPILEKLNGQYPDSEGTLHLENYDTADKAVRFVPKKEEEPTSGEEGATDASDEETVQP